MLKLRFLSALCLLVIINYSQAQDINVIPNLLSPYIRNIDELFTINIMANISEKLFNFKKMGFSFGKNY